MASTGGLATFIKTAIEGGTRGSYRLWHMIHIQDPLITVSMILSCMFRSLCGPFPLFCCRADSRTSEFGGIRRSLSIGDRFGSSVIYWYIGGFRGLYGILWISTIYYIMRSLRGLSIFFCFADCATFSPYNIITGIRKYFRVYNYI